jgi:predicted permease
MTHLVSDLRYAIRAFTRTPGFTATALLVLALGIGSNVAVFTVVNAVLLKPVGGSAPGKLVGLYVRERGRPDKYRHFTYDDYREIRGASQVFSGVLAQRFAPVLVSEGDASRRSFAAIVSSNYFSTLAVAPVVGRGFLPTDEDGSSPVVVVSHGYWQRTGATEVLGRSVRINGEDLTIVGVAPPGFSGTMALLSPEFWMPLGAAGRSMPSGTGGTSFSLAGRLRPGLSHGAAAPLVAELSGQLAAERPQEILVGDISRVSTSAAPPDPIEVRGLLFFLLGLSAIVLLIATLNLANMQLARGSARRRELAIRLAIGADRWRIVRQLLTESLALSLGGAALGVALAWSGTTLLAATLQPILPMMLAMDATPDVRVLGSAVGFAVVSTLIFGLVPALGLARTDIQTQVRAGSGRPGCSRARYTARNLLVVSQLALSLVLLAAAGLVMKGAWKAGGADPGYPLEHGVVATIDPTPLRHARWRTGDLQRETLARLRAIPGVESASVASSIAFGVNVPGARVRRAEARAEDAKYSVLTVAGAEYFSTLGIPVLRGREFSDAEERMAGGARPVIVNEPLARALWPDADPIGQRVQFAGRAGTTWEQPRDVVGVVRGVRQGLFDTAPVPQAFVPLADAPLDGETYFHLRVEPREPSEATVLQRVRQELREADPTLPVMSVTTLSDHRDSSIYLWISRASAEIFTWFGLAALGLATLGVYGVKSFLVAQRTGEIGIRVALGATRADILRLVIGDGMAWTIAALCAGAGLAVALSRVLANWVYGVGGVDLATLIAAIVLLVVTSLLASYLPARRAIALPPTLALRQE